MSFPNQKVITIQKEKCDSTNLYAKINIKALQKAMTELKTMGSIKLWLYLAKNQPFHTFALSCEECSKWGLKPDTYHAAVKELIAKGYLQKLQKQEYNFYEIGI